jgi:hypothetical protein
MQNASNLNASMHQKMEEQIHRKFIHERYYGLRKCTTCHNLCKIRRDLPNNGISAKRQQHRILLRPDEAI